MTLDIVMPRYDEPWEIGRPFFDMLGCQKGIDFNEFRVILVHDGSEMFPEETFAKYPYKVEQHRIIHKGVSAARNHGMEFANAKWLTFCDFDDAYSSVYSLKFIFDVLGTEDYDIVWNAFFVESVSKGIFLLNKNELWNCIWLHNKYFRLEWLKDLGLKFNEELHFSEDSAFLSILNVLVDAKRIGTIKSPFPLYTWCYRNGSATTNPEFRLRNMIDQQKRNEYVSAEFERVQYPDSDAMVARTMLDAYVALTSDNLPEGWEKIQQMAANFWKKNKHKFARNSEDTIRKVMKASMNKKEKELKAERPKLAEWLKGLEDV